MDATAIAQTLSNAALAGLLDATVLNAAAAAGASPMALLQENACAPNLGLLAGGAGTLGVSWSFALPGFGQSSADPVQRLLASLEKAMSVPGVTTPVKSSTDRPQ
ncbi:hypothetical protein FRC04_007502 [Tulasnella sp. 424]|nr:hypothetical protein FRC04_007502 [Tulasnella sp. 424]